jgi:hypothetical protein
MFYQHQTQHRYEVINQYEALTVEEIVAMAASSYFSHLSGSILPYHLELYLSPENREIVEIIDHYTELEDMSQLILIEEFLPGDHDRLREYVNAEDVGKDISNDWMFDYLENNKHMLLNRLKHRTGALK